MTPDQLEQYAEDKGRVLDEQGRKLDQLQRDFDQLRAKLQTPGTLYLRDLLWKQVFDETRTLAHNAQATSAVFETLQGLYHAFYWMSAFCPSSNTPVAVFSGGVVIFPATTVSVAIQRQRQTGPTRMESRVVYYNNNGTDQVVTTRIWRCLNI